MEGQTRHEARSQSAFPSGESLRELAKSESGWGVKTVEFFWVVLNGWSWLKRGDSAKGSGDGRRSRSLNLNLAGPNSWLHSSPLTVAFICNCILPYFSSP